MKAFNWFKPKPDAPKGLVRVDVEFTDDENAAMSSAGERFADVVTNAHAPEGTRMFVPPKVRNAILAQGLTDYVADILRKVESYNFAATTVKLMEKAINAQAKAYALHNLPIYLSRLTRMYENAGNDAKRQEFSQLFKRAHDEFQPDEIDKIFLELIKAVEGLEDEGCDISPELKDQLNRVLLAKPLYEAGHLCFSRRS